LAPEQLVQKLDPRDASAPIILDPQEKCVITAYEDPRHENDLKSNIQVLFSRHSCAVAPAGWRAQCCELRSYTTDRAKYFLRVERSLSPK
jgi:hypothetical protein